jgi:hypothetical protein
MVAESENGGRKAGFFESAEKLLVPAMEPVEIANRERVGEFFYRSYDFHKIPLKWGAIAQGGEKRRFPSMHSLNR